MSLKTLGTVQCQNNPSLLFKNNVHIVDSLGSIPEKAVCNKYVSIEF